MTASHEAVAVTANMPVDNYHWEWCTSVYKLQAPATVGKLLFAVPGLGRVMFSPSGHFLAGVHIMRKCPPKVHVLDFSSGACLVRIQAAELWPGRAFPADQTLWHLDVVWKAERQLVVTAYTGATQARQTLLHSAISF